MHNFGVRYAAMLGGMMMLFVNFVACGSQLYQVSMHDDSTLPPKTAEAANDPDSAQFGLHAAKGWAERLPIHFKVAQEVNDDQKRGLLRAMRIWETAVGRKLFVFEGVDSGVDGDSFKDLYSSLEDDVNGHYLDDNWAKTGKPQVVLATTIWDNDPADIQKITKADIRFNSNYYVIGDSFSLKPEGSREVVDMWTLALHELGHLLGLAHMNPTVDSYSIMTPSLYIGEGLSNRKLSRGDIERIQKIYGCEGSACDIDRVLAKIDLALKEDPTDVQANAALLAHAESEDPTDLDDPESDAASADNPGTGSKAAKPKVKASATTEEAH
jgi:hypothetical protein